MIRVLGESSRMGRFLIYDAVGVLCACFIFCFCWRNWQFLAYGVSWHRVTVYPHLERNRYFCFRKNNRWGDAFLVHSDAAKAGIESLRSLLGIAAYPDPDVVLKASCKAGCFLIYIRAFLCKDQTCGYKIFFIIFRNFPALGCSGLLLVVMLSAHLSRALLASGHFDEKKVT